MHDLIQHHKTHKHALSTQFPYIYSRKNLADRLSKTTVGIIYSANVAEMK